MLAEIWEEYVFHTDKSSQIARVIILAIFFMQVYSKVPISNLIIIYSMLEIFQYTYLGIRAELTGKKIISIKTCNKIRCIGCLFYYIKIIVVLTLLVEMI